jgi:hypothetical protein
VSSSFRFSLGRTFAVGVVLCAGLACSPPVEGEGESSEGEGEGEGEVCVIGDATAPAELSLVTRLVDGTIAPLADGGQVALLLPIQGGKVFYVGITGKNVTCHVQMTAGMFDSCQDPPVVSALDGRAVVLEDDGTGTAIPVNDPTDEVVVNFNNVPACPSFAASHDVDNGNFNLQLRVTEALRPGEAAPRVHNLTAAIVPTCLQPDLADDCACECDADFVLEQTKDEQCPTINDNDIAPGTCP